MRREEAQTNLYARAPRLAIGTALAGVLLLGACERDEVRRYIVEKERAQPAGATMAGAAAMQPRPGVEQPPLRWRLPSGWQEKQGGGDMRVATLTPPAGKPEVTVIRLPGAAGGELANVNRWRNQIGLAPLEEAQLPQQRKMLRTSAGDVALYDFTSEGAKKVRTVAGLLSVGGETWFLKLTGDAAEVAPVRPAFADLLGSLHLEAR